MKPIPETGYYSVLQYCPDRSRLEVANVGVVLFCPERKYLRARLSAGNHRVHRFFGSEAGDNQQLNAVKQMFEHWLEAEAPEIRDEAALRRFGSLLANELVMTDPRPLRVEHPDVELAQLFGDLVPGGGRREPAPEMRIIRELRRRLETPALQAKLQREVQVTVPLLGEELTMPYAYQNGRFNLIKAQEFSQHKEQDILRRACKSAVEGRLLFNHADAQHGARQLIVVAAFHHAARPYKRQIAEVLREHDVVFYDETALDALADNIAATAH